MKSKIRRYVVITIMLLSSVVLFIYLSNPQIFNCYTIFLSSDFNQTADNVYISKDTDHDHITLLIDFLDKADKRVKNFWQEKERVGNPVIIYCDNDDLLEKYSSKKSILAYNTPFKQFVVLGKKFINLDMLSHEIMHTEFTERIGYSNLMEYIPTWFNEGLALQVDYRKEYSSERYLELKDSLGININLDSISTPDAFYSGEFYYNYLAAGYTVKTWFTENKLSGLIELINNIKNGMTFNQAYNKEKMNNGN